MSGHSRDSERIFAEQDLGEPLGTLPSGVLLHDDGRPAGSRALGQRGGRGLCLVAAEAQALAETGVGGVARRGAAAAVLHAGGAARDWLGEPLPEEEKRLLIEQMLPALLALRGQARAGLLPHTDTGRRLDGLLTRRYLSIRMVYQHIDLLLALLGEQALRQLT